MNQKKHNFALQMKQNNLHTTQLITSKKSLFQAMMVKNHNVGMLLCICNF